MMMQQNSIPTRSVNPAALFNDDEEVHQFEGKYESKADVDQTKLIRLEVKSTQKVIRLDPKNDQRVPVMVSIKSLEEKKK